MENGMSDFKKHTFCSNIADIVYSVELYMRAKEKMKTGDWRYATNEEGWRWMDTALDFC